MASELSIILDDDSGDFIYSGSKWSLNQYAQWYNQTSWYPTDPKGGLKFTATDILGTFTMSFEGISIAFIGNTPNPDLAQNAAVSIDGGIPISFDYGDHLPPSYMQWYTSPALSDGKHTITMGHLASTSVDFAVVQVGLNTPLSGKRIIVDNEDSSISFSSNWWKSTVRFNSSNAPDGYPYGGSTHRSSTVGGKFTFKFTGTTVALYSIFDWTRFGVLSAIYDIDGSIDSRTYSASAASPQYLNSSLEATNYVLFSRNNLSNSEHTLVTTIVHCENQEFRLDYITYTPSFSTLASMRNLSNGPLTDPNTTSGLPGITSLTAEAPAVPTISSFAGVLAILVLVFIAMWLREKKRNKAGQTETVSPFLISWEGASSLARESLPSRRREATTCNIVQDPMSPSMYTASRLSPPAYASTFSQG